MRGSTNVRWAPLPLASGGNDVSVIGMLAVGATSFSLITHDATIPVLLTTGATALAPVAHEGTVSGRLWLAGSQRATVAHDATVTGHAALGASARAPVTHDATIIGHLSGGVSIVSLVTTSADVSVTGLALVGASMRATVAHDATLTGRVTPGASSSAPVTHDATITGRLHPGASSFAPVNRDATSTGQLAVGAWSAALVSGAVDISVAGLTIVGASVRATVAHHADLVAALHVGPSQRATVSHTATILAQLLVGSSSGAAVTRTASVISALLSSGTSLIAVPGEPFVLLLVGPLTTQRLDALRRTARFDPERLTQRLDSERLTLVRFPERPEYWLEPLVSRAFTPDTADLTITTDVVITAKVNKDVLGGAEHSTIVATLGGAPPTWAWRFWISFGPLFFDYSLDGTSIPGRLLLSSAEMSALFDDDTDFHIGVTVDLDNGAGNVQLQPITSSNGVTWTAAGAPVIAGPAAPGGFVDVAAALEVGAQHVGTQHFWKGRIQWVEMRTGLVPGAGLRKFRFDASEHRADTTWTDANGRTWTITNPNAIDTTGPTITGSRATHRLDAARATEEQP